MPQVTQMHNIQNIQNYHIELPQNMVLKDSDIRSLDRIADHNAVENSTQNMLMIPKRAQFNQSNPPIDRHQNGKV